MSLLFNFLTTDNILLVSAVALSCFVTYKTVQFCFITTPVSPSFGKGIGPTTLTTPTTSGESTVVPNILQVPDLTPLIVPAPEYHVSNFIEAIGEIFMMFMGF